MLTCAFNIRVCLRVGALNALMNQNAKISMAMMDYEAAHGDVTQPILRLVQGVYDEIEAYLKRLKLISDLIDTARHQMAYRDCIAVNRVLGDINTAITTTGLGEGSTIYRKWAMPSDLRSKLIALATDVKRFYEAQNPRGHADLARA
jgi:hypothetical protein